jgi:hypothetical protein
MNLFFSCKELPMSTTAQPRTRKLARTAIAVFVLLSCLRAWVGPVELVSEAQAQIPDSALQRKQLLDEVKRLNLKLAGIKHILTTHTFNVRIQGADNRDADN